jgi:RimJ/RimL family protein N-acetyltransferase
MKLVVRVKLLPTPVQAEAFEATLAACNKAANWLSGLVAVTQEANARSRRLLEALGATLAERFVEWGESQVLYRLSARA